MKVYEHRFECSNMVSPVDTVWDFYPYNEYDLSKLCFFDIETTGLSPDTASIYLIGAGYYEGRQYVVKQWFADDYNSEEIIIKEFLTFLQDYEILFEYNGNTFDIPFVRKKAAFYKTDCKVLNNIKTIDMYLTLRKYAEMLGLPNKKLKSFENYVGIIREDEYDGGALIEVYLQYIQKKFMNRENEEDLKLLLLHNYEDITGLSQVASLLYLKELSAMEAVFEKAYLSDEDRCLNIDYVCQVPYACSFFVDDYIKVVCEDKRIHLKINLYKGELRYYFADYKDYYYMIEEETVMHKSIAQYTDKCARRKAKKSECYVKKEDIYVPVTKHGCFSTEYHVFKEEYTSKQYYLRLADIDFTDTVFFRIYYGQVF